MINLPLILLGWSAIFLLFTGLIGVCYGLVDIPESPVRQAWFRYEQWLAPRLKTLRAKQSATEMMTLQIAGIGLTLLTAYITEISIISVLVIAISLFPPLVINKRLEERRTKLEEQLSTWFQSLANALKANPSLGESIASSACLMPAPMVEELDYAIKEMQLGTTLEDAMSHIVERANSPVVSSAITAILVGRQTGGEMPRLLEETSATLREMARLEGVVRTKTAEGKGQLWVLGCMPFALIGVIYNMDPAYLSPMFESLIGKLLLAGAFMLWSAAILLARKILNVDI